MVLMRVVEFKMLNTLTVGFDTEFFNSKEKQLTVVCAVLSFPDESRRFFFPEDFLSFKETLNCIKEQGGVLLAYAASAESRSLLSLGIDPLQFKWKDLYVEFRMLCNSNDKYNYGPYIDEKGQIRHSTPPEIRNYYEEDKEDAEEDSSHHKEVPKNLINAIFRLLCGLVLDTDQKSEMRELILSGNVEEHRLRKDEILEYCESDTKHLRALDEALFSALRDERLTDFDEDQLQRGRYSVCMSIAEHRGIPIDIDLLDRVVDKTPHIMEVYKKNVNQHFPCFTEEIPGREIVLKNGTTKHTKPKPSRKDQKAYENFIETLDIKNFPKTNTGKYKSDKQTLVDFREYHPGIRELLLFNVMASNLKWFSKDNLVNGFSNYLGTDGKCRPFFGIFGTQTGRNAAKAVSFPFAMSSWLRTIVRAEPGKAIVGSDFSAQELYVAAVLSGDENFLEAYTSGDFYIAFGKKCGLIPDEGTKETHKLERNICKAVVLGLQFGLGASKLALTLSNVTQKEVSEDEAREYIGFHKEIFSVYWKWIYGLSDEYKKGIPLITSDGWTLFTDNPIMTSVRNFPVQAHGASITRRAVTLCVEQGLPIIASLHDAIYLHSAQPEIDAKKLKDVMIAATAEILGQSDYECSIRIDTKIIPHEETFIEEKGEKAWAELKPLLYPHPENTNTAERLLDKQPA